MWASGAVGSAPEWHSGGHGFESRLVHQTFISGLDSPQVAGRPVVAPVRTKAFLPTIPSGRNSRWNRGTAANCSCRRLWISSGGVSPSCLVHTPEGTFEARAQVLEARPRRRRNLRRISAHCLVEIRLFAGHRYQQTDRHHLWDCGQSPQTRCKDLSAINGSSQALVNTALFPNPSAALGSQLVGNNIFFNGTNAKASTAAPRRASMRRVRVCKGRATPISTRLCTRRGTRTR